jgi:hypothetical protein
MVTTAALSATHDRATHDRAGNGVALDELAALAGAGLLAGAAILHYRMDFLPAAAVEAVAAGLLAVGARHRGALWAALGSVLAILFGYFLSRAAGIDGGSWADGSGGAEILATGLAEGAVVLLLGLLHPVLAGRLASRTVRALPAVGAYVTAVALLTPAVGGVAL